MALFEGNASAGKQIFISIRIHCLRPPELTIWVIEYIETLNNQNTVN